MFIEEVILKMVEFYEGDPKRIQHFLKVYEFAHIIGTMENIDENTLFILDIASVMHDIGIRPAEKKYGSSDGKLQEKEGPPYAKEILARFSQVSSKQIERVCYLIGHHHTYENVDGMDYRILLEADFLVNALEDNISKDGIIHFRDRVFETKTGLYLINTMFGL